jgi:pSer/pThr/pTyr-binding forkhead associated (FHA) protein/S1-C subfamily serine protease
VFPPGTCNRKLQAMPYLRLIDVLTGRTLEFEQEEVRIGRAPDCDIVPEGEGAKVVSGYHVRFVTKNDSWLVEDLGSRNGTFIGDIPAPGHVPRPVEVGTVIGLGERGPRYRVDALANIVFDQTIEETPKISRPSAPTLPLSAYGATEPFDASGMPEPRKPPKTTEAESIEPVRSPPPPSATEKVTERMGGIDGTPAPEPVSPERVGVRIVVVEARSGERWEGQGGRIRVGRGKECELRPIGPSDTSVSRVHAEIIVQPNGRVVIRDAQSRNGTLVNKEFITGECEIKTGDRIQLGDQGPDLSVDVLEFPAGSASDFPPAAPPHEELVVPRRSFGGKGATVFFKEMFHDSQQTSARRVRVVVWSAVAVLVVAVGGIYWWSERRVRETAAELERRQRLAITAIADSISQSATAEYESLRRDLAEARAGSAPAAVVESLQVAFNAAQERADALEAALERAQASLTAQLAAGDSIQRAAQAELQRVRTELNRASASGTGAALLDSLRGALADAEQRSAQIDRQMRAVRQVDLPAVAQANQGAIGLVTAFIGEQVYDGTGFVLTPSGYMVTNRHVVSRDEVRADSVYVTMADQKIPRRGTVVMVASFGAPDLAMIKIEDYDGAYVPKVDWSGTNVGQGASAALIGFPAGLGNALDRTQTVRTLMAAGIFSRVTSDDINFDGFTTGGSSGSPIFNASGEVVAVHRAGLRDATGLSFAVPIAKLIPLLPAEVRRELGLQ